VEENLDNTAATCLSPSTAVHDGHRPAVPDHRARRS
jgi:hypothetical protein